MPAPSKVKGNSVDWLFIKRIAKIFRIILKPLLSKFLFSLIISVVLGQTLVVSYTGNVIGDFYTVIENEDLHQFWHVLLVGSGVVLASAAFDSTNKFLIELIAWKWRNILCFHVQDRYFADHLYYKILSLDSRIDNPDQRITQVAKSLYLGY